MASKIYTRTGDFGETSLFGGTRVKKYDDRVEAYGTVDELNAAVGAALPFVADQRTREALVFLMHKLLNCSSNLAVPPDAGPPTCQIQDEDVTFLESSIDWMDAAAGPLGGFILPTGSEAAGHLHLARTICRRAERRIVRLAAVSHVDPKVAVFINRASDFLFAAARAVQALEGAQTMHWDRALRPPR